ncbi:hypothetical protein M9458_054155, partial [Cirrhinus mrigala]
MQPWRSSQALGCFGIQLPRVVDNASGPEEVSAFVQGEHVLVCTDNTATVAYIDHQDGVRSFRMSQLTHHLLLWSKHRLKLLCATQIPGDKFVP